LHIEISIPESPMAYLPHNFCRSNGCLPFGKFGWDPTVTGSLSSFFSVNSCCVHFLQCCSSCCFYPSYPAISTVAINDNNHQHAFVACSIFANRIPILRIQVTQSISVDMKRSMSNKIVHGHQAYIVDPCHYDLNMNIATKNRLWIYVIKTQI
jgi:hypothetical protein